MKEENEICLHLNDALYNAGLVGLIRVLEEMDEFNIDGPCFRYDEKGSSVIVRKTAFSKKFTDAYVDVLLQHYGSNTMYMQLVAALENIQNADRKNRNFQDNLKKCVQQLGKTIKRPSYKSGFEILEKYYGIGYDFIGTADIIKTEKEPEKQLKMIEEITREFKNDEVQHVLELKDITYTQVQNYWNGISFLHKSKNKEPLEKAFTSYFMEAIWNEKPRKRKKSIQCFQCGRDLPARSPSMAWVNQTMPDIKRKTDSFWNYNPDFYLCPYCSLVYACIPIGFTSFASEGIFVNDNRSIRCLMSANNFDNVSDELKRDPFAVIINRFALNTREKQAQNLTQNIQVIRNSHGNYQVNTLTADMLNAFIALKPVLQKLLKANPYLFHKTLEYVLNSRELYGFLTLEYRKALKEGQRFNIYSLILEVQIEMFGRKKGNDMINSRMDKKAKAYKAGQALRENVERVDQNGKSRANSKRLVGVTYHLLNALQSGNSQLFMNTVERRYLSLGLDIPSIFLDAIGNDELMQIIGHAFVQGLNSSESNVANNKIESRVKQV